MDRAWRALGPPGTGFLGRGNRGRVEKKRSKLDGRDPVDHAVMGLADEADATTLELIGDADLPHGAIARQLPRHAGVGKIGQPVGARPNHVPVDVEILVIHPHRCVHAQRHLGEPLPVARRSAEPALDVVAKLREAR